VVCSRRGGRFVRQAKKNAILSSTFCPLRRLIIQKTEIPLGLISIETSGLARLLTTARQEAIFLIMTHID
jgi:hypothetical protein